MAHDYKTDFNNLRRLLETKTRYIGLLGPRKRTEKMFDAMMKEGNVVSEENMQRIFSPAGLDIGALTPFLWMFEEREKVKRIFFKKLK